MGLSKKKRAKERERERGNFLEISANLPNGTLSGLSHMTSEHYEQERVVGQESFLKTFCIQSDASRWSKPLVDIKTKGPFFV